MLKSVSSRFLTQLFSKARRPLLIVGQGVRLGKADEEFKQVVARFKIPVLSSRLGKDLLEYDSPYFVGHPGTYGTPPAWHALEATDLILSVGSRLSTITVNYDPHKWAPQAILVMVDVDEKELEKHGNRVAAKILMEAKRFFKILLKSDITVDPQWLKQCQAWKRQDPVVSKAMRREYPINSYFFIERLSELASRKDTIIVDTGSCFHVAAQVWKIKKGQKFLTTGGISSMGWWVAALGAAVLGQTVLITGDGSLQMNIQELATVKHYNLPIKMFVLNNEGYGLIRLTQEKYFGKKHLVGESPATGVWCPDLQKVAQVGYGLHYRRIRYHTQIDRVIKAVLAYKKGPVVCEVFTPKWQKLLKLEV